MDDNACINSHVGYSTSDLWRGGGSGGDSPLRPLHQHYGAPGAPESPLGAGGSEGDIEGSGKRSVEQPGDGVTSFQLSPGDMEPLFSVGPTYTYAK